MSGLLCKIQWSSLISPKKRKAIEQLLTSADEDEIEYRNEKENIFQSVEYYVDGYCIDKSHIINAVDESVENLNEVLLPPLYTRSEGLLSGDKIEEPETKYTLLGKTIPTTPSSEVRISQRTCWNCNSSAHSFSDCPLPKNKQEISKNRQLFLQSRSGQKEYGRRFFSANLKVHDYIPGQLSDELRNALGISKDEYPPWFVRFLTFGFPPSYQKQQIDEESLKIYNNSDDGKDNSEIDKRNSEIITNNTNTNTTNNNNINANDNSFDMDVDIEEGEIIDKSNTPNTPLQLKITSNDIINTESPTMYNNNNNANTYYTDNSYYYNSPYSNYSGYHNHDNYNYNYYNNHSSNNSNSNSPNVNNNYNYKYTDKT